MKIIKKLILLIVFVLLSTNVLAQNFEVKIIEYEPEVSSARLFIKNTASTDFHDLKMKIDNSIEISLADFVRAGTTFATYQIISPGQHTLTLTTKEGTIETKNLYFPQTQEQLKQDIEKRLDEERSQDRLKTPPPEKSNFNYLYIIFGIIALGIIYWLYKKLK